MPRVAAVIVERSSVALIERRVASELSYLFPGGQAEVGEALPDAVAREVQEELGLQVTVRRLVAEVSYKGRAQYYYLADVRGGDFGTGKSVKIAGVASLESGTYTPTWMPIIELLDHSVYPRCVAALVITAMKDGWPEEVLTCQDKGRP